MASGYLKYDVADTRRNRAIFLGLPAAMLLGGAGLSYPALSAAIELLAIVALCWLLPRLVSLKIPPISMAALVLLIATLLLPLLQLVPLPWQSWSALPGRALAAAIQAQAGLAEHAMPLSLRPDATAQALLALVPPAAAFIAVLGLDEHGRIVVLRGLVAVAVLSAVLGALQLASRGMGGFTLFESAHRGSALGLFVNHNHSASFLLIGMVAASVPGVLGGRHGAGGQGPAAFGIVALLALAVLGTTSRTGLLSLSPVLLLCSYLRFPRLWRSWWLLAGIVLLAAIAVGVAQLPLAQTVLARFEHLDQDGRHSFWVNTLYLIHQFLPWGSGFGTFTTLYPTVEPLDQVMVPIVNHAHDDYLELALEGGMPALVLLVVGLGLAAAAFFRALRRSEAKPWQSRSVTIAAGAIVAILVAHSVDDYPLRMYALSVAFAASLAMLFPRARRRRSRPAPPAAIWATRAVSVAAGLVLAWQAVSIGVASQLLLRDAPAQAVQWRPGSDEAWSRLATQRALAADWNGGAAAARAALARAPLDPAAVRTLGLAAAAARDETAATQWMLLGGQLGWRDVPTQLWLIQRAIELRQPMIAVQRADGLLRQDKQSAPLFEQLGGLLAEPAGRDALAQVLVLRPSWRGAFLNSLVSGGQVRGEDMVGLYRALAAGGAAVDMAESAAVLDMLWRAGRYPDAYAVWAAAGGTGLITDGGFEQSEGALRGTGPFTWHQGGLVGVRADAELPETPWHGRALRIESSGIGAGPAAVQRLVLAPGTYALRFVARDNGDAAARPSWEIGCAPDFAASGPPPPVAWSMAGGGWLRGELRFDIDRSCVAQELRLIVNPVHHPQSIWVDDVIVSKISTQ